VAWFRQLDDIDLYSEATQSTVDREDTHLREDTVQPSLSRLAALANAPDLDGDLFRVPGVMKR